MTSRTVLLFVCLKRRTNNTLPQGKVMNSLRCHFVTSRTVLLFVCF